MVRRVSRGVPCAISCLLRSEGGLVDEDDGADFELVCIIYVSLFDELVSVFDGGFVGGEDFGVVEVGSTAGFGDEV